MGRRSPIFREAFWLSSERICGFWINLVSVSPITVDRLAEGIVTAKLLAFRVARVFRLIPAGVLDVVEVVVVLEETGFRLLCSAREALVGGLKPRVLERSLLICITAMSMMTSGRALSRSSTSFSASAIWSGVPRTTRAFCESNCCTRCTSSTARIAFTTSCSSVGAERFVR